MASYDLYDLYDCCDCRNLFHQADITERICCLRQVCLTCYQNSAKCLDCPNVARIQVNRDRLQQEIVRVNEVLQEQVEFYFKFGSVNGQLTPEAKAAAQVDAKAGQIHLDLLLDLQQRLALPHNFDKMVWIPQGSLVRSKDYRDGHLVDSDGVVTAEAYNQSRQYFYESHKIAHAWEGSRPPLHHQYLKRLQLGAGVIASDLTGETGLANMTLTHLVMNFAKITDLTALTGPLSQHLVELSVFASYVADITALANMKVLQRLDLALTQVSDITPLTGLVLTELDLGATRVADITALKGMPLVILRLNITNVTDLNPLRDAPLVNLTLDYTPVRDLSPLANLPLKKLSLFMAEADVTPVAGIAGLEIVAW